MKMSEEKLRFAREKLAKIIKSHGFSREITPMTVYKLTREGFNIGGRFGAKFNRETGLIIWNKSSRNSGRKFSLSELSDLEQELEDEFISIWKNKQEEM